MHRIDTDGHVNNKFVNENADNFQQATIVDAAWLTSIQEEIAHAIEGAGITLDKTNQSQLFQAIQLLVPVVSNATYEKSGLVKPDGISISVSSDGTISTVLKTVNGESPDAMGNIELLTTQICYGDGV